MSPSKPRPAASSSGDLPADALYEVLLRIPAKELCRLRAVCPAWRALTSDPIFAAAHKSRHHTAPPLLATAYHDHSGVSGVSISDLSGNVVKRIPVTGYEIVRVNRSDDPIGRMSSKDDSIFVVSTRLNLVCFNWIDYPMAFSVLNPATGATIDLPTSRSKELEHELEVGGIDKWRCQIESCAFGQVSSTREYKALRIFRVGDRQVYEVITFDGTNHGSWRRKQDLPSLISTSRKMRCVVVDGVVHFLMDFFSTHFRTDKITIEPGSIASFNLETEDWMDVLRGPEPVYKYVQEDEVYGYPELELQLSLAELSGYLVMVRNIHNISVDLWFLTDSEKGSWVKKYSMPSDFAKPFRYPFLMLDDGRIFFSVEGYLQGISGNAEPGQRFLVSYDPRNDTYADALKLRDSISIGIYTGSPLSL